MNDAGIDQKTGSIVGFLLHGGEARNVASDTLGYASIGLSESALLSKPLALHHNFGRRPRAAFAPLELAECARRDLAKRHRRR